MRLYDAPYLNLLHQRFAAVKRRSYELLHAGPGPPHFTFPVVQGAQQLPPAETLAAPYLVRSGRPEDATALEALNLKWAYANRTGDLAQGFLLSLYSKANFGAIIAAREIAVLELLPIMPLTLPLNTFNNEQFTQIGRAHV